MTGPKLYPLGSHIKGVRNNNGHRTSQHQATKGRSNAAAVPLARVGAVLPWVAPTERA